MNDNIPLPIIGTKLNTIPPVRIKAPIRKPGNLSPAIKPAMKKAKKAQNQKESRRQHKFNNRHHKGRKI